MSNPPKEKRKALGRGLGALLPSTPAPSRPEKVAKPMQTAGKRSFYNAQVEDVYPSPDQPRRRFNEALLDELAASIKVHGVIQPLIVRERKAGGYHLIAGERRWRASQRAGLSEVPIVIQSVSPQESYERAIVENIQRADLNAIEEATAYQHLSEEYSLTQEEVAKKVGKDRSTVANSMRLLKLPNSVREMVEDGRLGMGHARAILGLESAAAMERVAKTALGEKLSVRAVEALVRGKPAAASSAPTKKSASVRDVENRLTKSLGAAVQLTEKKSGKGGRIEIKYADLDDLDRLLERLLHR